MTDHLTTATEAFTAVFEAGEFMEFHTAFVCPYPNCRAYAQHTWGELRRIELFVGSANFTSRMLEAGRVRVALCHQCMRDVIWVDDRMVKPTASDAPPPAKDMPAEILGEYEEAGLILNASPRGAAALLRLAVQKLLPLLGATKRDINDQIGELVGNGTLPQRLSDALDIVRVIGNEAVHPGTIDLKDDRETAVSLFRLLNFIVEKAISEPNHENQLFGLLPQGKKDGIAQRNAREIAKANAAQGS